MNNSQLRNFINLILEEEGKKLQRSTGGLALMIKKMSGETNYVLYDSKELSELLETEWIDEGEEDEVLEKLSMSAIKSMLVTGNVQPKDGKCYSGKMVKNSASAEPGYGQIVYKVALGLEGPLIPDRRTVSDDAKQQWSKVAAGKRGKQNSLKLDDVSDPKTPPIEDDCKLIARSPEEEYLDFAYSLESAPAETQSMMKQHKETTKFVEQKLTTPENPFDVKNAFEMAMVVAADWLFRKQYKPS